MDWPFIIIVTLILACILSWLFWPSGDKYSWDNDEVVKPNKSKSMKTSIWSFAKGSSSDNVTQIVPRKRYIQLKDTHVARTGMIWEWSGYDNVYQPVNVELMKVSDPFQWREPKRSIEGNTEWFEELVPIYVNKDMMNKIGTLALESK